MPVHGTELPCVQVHVVTSDGRVAVEEVFMFSHQDATAYSHFISITTSYNVTISASDGHYLPVSTRSSAALADAKPVRAADISPGNVVWSLPTQMGSVHPTVVTSVLHSELVGKYNPHTASGTIIVDNVAAYTFTETISPSLTTHSLVTAIARMLYSCFKAIGMEDVLVPVNTLLLHLYHNKGMSALLQLTTSTVVSPLLGA